MLPLLHAEVVVSGWVSGDAFLAGYGAAQAISGPLLTFSAFLGAVMEKPMGGVWGRGGLPVFHLHTVFSTDCRFFTVLGCLAEKQDHASGSCRD